MTRLPQASGFIALAALLIAWLAPVAVRAAEPDCQKAEGALIQSYRDEYVPREFACPSRAWVYADVAVLSLLLASGAWIVLAGKPSGWISAQLAVALLYFGLFRGGCICPVGATANVSLALLHPELIGRATLAIFLLPLLVALLCGRVFCAAVCPLGAFQHFVSARFAKPLPALLHKALLGLPPLVLAATALMAAGRLGFLPCMLDPYKPLFFSGHALVQKLASLAGLGFSEPGIILAGSVTAWGILAGVVIIGRRVPRPFCRYACPYGVLLGLVSIFAFRRRRIDPDFCAACSRCEKTCPVQAISVDPLNRQAGASISSYQCVQCGRCSDGCKFQASTMGPS